MLLSREAFFLCSRDNVAIDNETGSAIVIEGRDAEDGNHLSGGPDYTSRFLLAWVARLFVLALSSGLALGGAELVMRRVRPQVPLGEFEQRYAVDGRTSAIPCYFANDAVLPFALRRGFHHSVADLLWAPEPVRVDTDSFGYRNREGALDTAKIVLVGDSVVFGFGAAESSTLAANLSSMLNEPVYNLGIPGADPATYTAMLRRYLGRARPRVIVIGYYRANDAYELSLASWSELARCAAPASKIRREDFVPYAPQYPTWVANSVLKHSHLAAAIVSALTLPRVAMSDDDLVRLHGLLSKNAATALDDLHATLETRAAGQARATELAMSLIGGRCVSASQRGLLQKYIDAMAAHRVPEAMASAAQVVDQLIAQRCSPIERKTWYNATITFRFWATVQPRRLGHINEGDVRVYRELLRTLRARPAFASLRGQIDAVDREVNIQSASAAAAIRKFQENLISVHPAPPPPAQCDLMELFLAELARLASESHAKLVLLDIPAEHQLKYMVDHPAARPSDLCARAERRRIPCLDLMPRLLDHYAESNDSLYVDLSHFNEKGSLLFAQYVAPWIRKQEGH